MNEIFLFFLLYPLYQKDDRWVASMTTHSIRFVRLLIVFLIAEWHGFER